MVKIVSTRARVQKTAARLGILLALVRWGRDGAMTEARVASRSSGPGGLRADDLPVHFFTIVLNGDPFIRYHLDVFRGLPFRWHWHIVEGVAALVRDTAWSVAAGGRI